MIVLHCGRRYKGRPPSQQPGTTNHESLEATLLKLIARHPMLKDEPFCKLICTISSLEGGSQDTLFSVFSEIHHMLFAMLAPGSMFFNTERFIGHKSLHLGLMVIEYG